MKHTWE